MTTKAPIVLPEHLCTDPTSDRFFKGASFSHKADVLQYVSPQKFQAIEILLLAALRDEFAAIGPNPANYRQPGGDPYGRDTKKGGA